MLVFDRLNHLLELLAGSEWPEYEASLRLALELDAGQLEELENHLLHHGASLMQEQLLSCCRLGLEACQALWDYLDWSQAESWHDAQALIDDASALYGTTLESLQEERASLVFYL